MLSIIIPTLNEEDYLGATLESIKQQNLSDYEIIIADAVSKDATVDIAKKYGCIVIEGGLPARGRNNGAKASKGELLFFLDADTVLPEGFFEKSLQEFKERNLDMAAFQLFFKDQENAPFLLDKMYNNMVMMLENIIPLAIMGVFIKRPLFEKLGGYNEDIKISEDGDFGRRALKMKAKYGVITSTYIFISDRRFVKDGWFKTMAKYFLSQMHTTFIGPVKSDIFKYKFDHYKDKKK
jgi:glycosyltransferase involved in cell wall biosynthesis